METRNDSTQKDGDGFGSTEVPRMAKKSLIDVAAIRGDTPAMHEEGDVYSTNRQTYPVKKPGNKAWFRAHPDPQFHLPNVRLLEDSEDRSKYILPKGYTPPSDVQEFVEYVTSGDLCRLARHCVSLAHKEHCEQLGFVCQASC